MSIAYQIDYRSCGVAELVRAAQQGDREAFGALFERYRGPLLAMARQRLGNADEAEELVQEVFIKAMEKLDQLRVPEAFGGWLRRIVHRMAINRVTRGGRDLACDPVTLEATCWGVESPEGAVVTREEADHLRVGLGKLGPLDRSTLEAFYLRGESLLEMSDSFEAPVGTIKRRLHVARKRLAKQLEVLQAV
jgi:RNA polymerase sigma-70 factor (ECF subfamily)